MGIKVKVVEGTKEQMIIKYPVLKQAENGLIVEFTARREGTVKVIGHSSYAYNYYAGTWTEEDFAIFTGKVILSNIL